MTPAPALDCAACGHTIPKRASHNATYDGRILCMKCLTAPRLHGDWYPDCMDGWHDVQDHLRYVAGTRAGVAAALGLWP